MAKLNDSSEGGVPAPTASNLALSFSTIRANGRNTWREKMRRDAVTQRKTTPGFRGVSVTPASIM
jgi:hypothetical protein